MSSSGEEVGKVNTSGRETDGDAEVEWSTSEPEKTSKALATSAGASERDGPLTRILRYLVDR